MPKNAKSAQAPKARSKPPEPFTTAPKQLDSFLGALDPAQVYITHVDRLPIAFKQKIFAVPVLMNIAIVLLLVWRLYSILPTYLDLMLIAMGYPSPAMVNQADKDTQQLRSIVLRRTGMILLDFILFRFIGVWPFMFFFEQPVSPALWRLRIRFRESEIVVRTSRKWGAKELWADGGPKDNPDMSPANTTVRERVIPAVDSEWMRERTGYMMMGRNYDLDFPAMLDAESMVEKGEAKLSDFSKALFANLEGHGWLMWKFEDDAPLESSPEEKGLEEDARKRMERLKNLLAAQGKERLFYRWIELIQYESEQPGGLSPQRYPVIVQKARDLFSKEGVDFDELLKSVGGAEQFPGLQQIQSS